MRVSAMTITTAGELTPGHVGCMVLGIPEILGWERRLILRDIQQGDAETYLGFQWNDSPDAANTKRGQFAIGIKVSPESPIEVVAQ